jgi:hypothetical protein
LEFKSDRSADPTIWVRVGPRPIRCADCGARFPLEETVKGDPFCGCGGDLIGEVDYYVRLPQIEMIDITVKVI